MLLPTLIWHSDRTKLVYFKFFRFAYTNMVKKYGADRVRTNQNARIPLPYNNICMYLLTEGKGWKGKIFDSRSRHTDRTQRGLCFTAGSQILSRPARPKSVISNFIFLFLLFFSQFPAHGAAQLFKALLTPSRTALTRGFLSKIVSKAQSKRIFVRTYLLFRFEYAQIYIYIYIYVCKRMSADFHSTHNI